jgi:hypothetical protein
VPAWPGPQVFFPLEGACAPQSSAPIVSICIVTAACDGNTGDGQMACALRGQKRAAAAWMLAAEQLVAAARAALLGRRCFPTRYPQGCAPRPQDNHYL